MRSAFSRLNHGSLALRPAALLALLSELTRFASSHRELLLPGFRRFGRPPRRRISLRCQLGNLHRRDSHPLEHRLASLHYPTALVSTLLTLPRTLDTPLPITGIVAMAAIETSAVTNAYSTRSFLVCPSKKPPPLL